MKIAGENDGGRARGFRHMVCSSFAWLRFGVAGVRTPARATRAFSDPGATPTILAVCVDRMYHEYVSMVCCVLLAVRVVVGLEAGVLEASFR